MSIQMISGPWQQPDREPESEILVRFRLRQRQEDLFQGGQAGTASPGAWNSLLSHIVIGCNNPELKASQKLGHKIMR